MSSANESPLLRDVPRPNAGGEDDTPAPRVVVIILNWNGAPDTIRCVRKVQRLGVEGSRCLVVDNGSSDDSVAAIREVCPDVPLHETGENLGFAGGCNAGIRVAMEHGADYVWLLNNDAVPASGALDALLAVAEADAGVGAVGSVLRYLQDPLRVQTWGGGWHWPWLGAAINWRRPVPGAWVTYLVGASLLLRTRALEEVGLLDAGFFMYREDVDLCVRLRRAGWTLAVAPESTVYHAVGGSSTGAAQRDRWIAASAVRYYRKQAPWPGAALAVETAGKMAARVFRGEWDRARTVWAATLEAWHGEP
jgi:GT2 family glycosyltransferase